MTSDDPPTPPSAALTTADLVLVRAAAAALPMSAWTTRSRVSCLIEAHDPPERFEPAAVR